MNNAQIQQGVHLILEGLGVDRSDHNFHDTPHRFAKAMEELFAQPEKTATTFEEQYTDFVLVRGHEMWTFCPHHLLPVRMCVSIAYIPDGKVLGLSKLVRIMQLANSGPIMQERFTYTVREKLAITLEESCKGIAVHVVGTHDCMRIRGVKSSADTITQAFTGEFETNQRVLDRFMMLVGR